jgi:hypothetical protein
MSFCSRLKLQGKTAFLALEKRIIRPFQRADLAALLAISNTLLGPTPQLTIAIAISEIERLCCGARGPLRAPNSSMLGVEFYLT